MIMKKIFLLLWLPTLCLGNGLHIPDGSHPIVKHVVSHKKKKIIESDVSQDSWIPHKVGMQPTQRTIQDHDNIIEMIRDMGYHVEETDKALVVRIPERYNVRHGLPDAAGFMRAMSLTNEIANRHFLMYPDISDFNIKMQTNKGINLIDYTIDKSDWDKSNGSVGLTFDSLSRDGIMNNLKISPLIKDIRK